MTSATERENDEEQHGKTLFRDRGAEDFLQRLDRPDGLIFVDRIDGRAQRASQSGGRTGRAQDDVERAERILRVGLVGLARGLLVDSVLFDVGDDADDLAPGVGAVCDQDAFADRVLVREKLPGERFVNDRDARRAGVIVLIERGDHESAECPWRGNNRA